jgi:hypothetical protein
LNESNRIFNQPDISTKDNDLLLSVTPHHHHPQTNLPIVPYNYQKLFNSPEFGEVLNKNKKPETELSDDTLIFKQSNEENEIMKIQDDNSEFLNNIKQDLQTQFREKSLLENKLFSTNKELDNNNGNNNSNLPSFEYIEKRVISSPLFSSPKSNSLFSNLNSSINIPRPKIYHNTNLLKSTPTKSNNLLPLIDSNDNNIKSDKNEKNKNTSNKPKIIKGRTFSSEKEKENEDYFSSKYLDEINNNNSNNVINVNINKDDFRNSYDGNYYYYNNLPFFNYNFSRSNRIKRGLSLTHYNNKKIYNNLQKYENSNSLPQPPPLPNNNKKTFSRPRPSSTSKI